MSSIDDHKFNDDLLVNESDVKKVRDLYPALEHILYDGELIDYFMHYNKNANAAKSNSRKWGKWAIVLGALAIALAALEIGTAALGSKTWPLLIGTIAATCGLVSVGIGALNVLFGSRKRNWLHNRFMGERIRQFHFQLLIAQLPQILELLECREKEAADLHDAFKRQRRHQFLRFKNQFEGHVGDRFTSAIGPHGDKYWWLPEASEMPSLREHRHQLEPLFAAYRDLRIEHQLGYANYKLQSDHRLFSPLPVRQTEVLENLSKAGIAWLVLIHIAVLAIILLEVTTTSLPDVSVFSIVFCVAIVAIAVVGLAARAFQQGLQPEREVERYQQYRSALQNMLEQFDESELPNQKVMVMRRMERLAYDEMRNFLITNDRSSFSI